MSNQISKKLKKTKEEIGDQYRICTIDFVPCLYRDFGNGFNVEISGFYSRKNKVTLYLWFGEDTSAVMVKKIDNIDLNTVLIHESAEQLYEDSKKLINQGYNSRDKVFCLVHPEMAEMAGMSVAAAVNK